MPEITLRDYFAGLAMNAIIIGNNADICTTGVDGATGMAKDAFNVADAMLAARGVQEINNTATESKKVLASLRKYSEGKRPTLTAYCKNAELYREVLKAVVKYDSMLCSIGKDDVFLMRAERILKELAPRCREKLEKPLVARAKEAMEEAKCS